MHKLIRLDGYIGSDADCTAPGAEHTYAWYELAPNPPVNLKLAVAPGDLLSARVSIAGDRVKLHIENLTTRRSFTKTVAMPSPNRSSAEWIAEAPSACVSGSQCQTLPLTDFGAVRFTHARASIAGARTSGTITDPAFAITELKLSAAGPMLGQPGFVTSSTDTAQARPSSLSQNGGVFTVSFKQPTSPAPRPPSATAADQLRRPPRRAAPL